MGADIGCCRLIFGEADQFPGLTVDRFGDILVTQTLSLGIEKRKIKPMLFEELLGPLREDGQTIRGIYERNDAQHPEAGRDEENKGFFRLQGMPVLEYTQTRIQENGIPYIVDFENGKKPVSFWIRNTTAVQSPHWRVGKRCGFVYLYPDLSRSTRQKPRCLRACGRYFRRCGGDGAAQCAPQRPGSEYEF